MKTSIILLLLLMGLQNFVLAQFSINGKITDKDTQEPLSHANIILENTYYATISNSQGEFSFKNVKRGNYSLRISYLGYKTIIKNINMDKNLNLNFEMQSTYIMEDEVIINAVRANEQSPVTFENITKKEIREVNLGQDIPYIIENTPSVVVTSDAGAGVGYTDIRIRGTDISRINVTINGIPLNDPESNSVFWVDIPDLASSIDQMQIQRGVGTSTNGASAFGASINILTQKINTNPYAELNASYGSFNTYKTNMSFGTGLIKNKWSFDGRVSRIGSDGYIDRAWSDLKSFFLSASYNGKKSLLKINIFSGKEKTYQAWGGVPQDKLESDRTYNPYTYNNEIDDYQQDHYHLIYSAEIADVLQLNASAFYIKGKGYYEQFREDDELSGYGLDPIRLSGPFVIIGQDTTFFPDSTIGSTTLVRQKWLDNDFYGITYSLTYRKSNVNAILGGAWNKYDGNHFGEIIWAQYTSNAYKDYEWYRNKGVKRDFNIFGKVEYQLLENLNLYGDLQYRTIKYTIDGIHDDLRDLTQERGFDFFNPKLGLFCNLTNRQSVYFSWALANREPSRGNYRDADPGKVPQSEVLNDFELGYEYKSRVFRINTNLYFMKYKDQLVLTGEINNVGDPIMVNVPESYRAGLEIAAGVKICKKIRWDMNMTLSQNKIKDFTSYVDSYDPNWAFMGQRKIDLGTTDLSFSPNIITNSNITFEAAKNLKINLISKYVGNQFIDNTSSNDRKLDAYFINDLLIEYSLITNTAKEINFYLMINNIFNIMYESNAWVYSYYLGGQRNNMFGYYPQAGINFMAGISIKFLSRKSNQEKPQH